MESKYPTKSVVYALNRLYHAAQYGPDMRSSRDLCVDDAVSLLREALSPEAGTMPREAEVYVKAALACLLQNAHFDADIRWAKTHLTDAIVVLDHA